MTDIYVPRGAGPGLAPNALPSVSWFEFVLNDSLLEQHLAQENPEPSAVQLIVQFMQQAEVEMASLIQNTREQSAASVPQPLPDIRVDGNNEETPIEESRKVKALRALALRVAAHLHWDLAILEKGVPTPIVQALLIELLKIAAPDLIDCIHSPDLEDTAMSDQSLFAVHLFHRWCVRSVVRDSFPTRPVKQNFVPPPGQLDPNAVMVAATETIIRKFREQLPSSISYLEKCCQDQISVKMPTMACFVLPKEKTHSIADWQQTVDVPSEKIVCQISFDLGSLYFFEKEYRKAFEKFRTCKQILNQLKDREYCNISEDRLRGYLTSCSSLLGVTMEGHAPSLFDRAEASRKKEYQGIVGILQEDNLKQELTMAYRTSVQDELSKSGQHELHIQVTLCNVVRTVVEGQAVVTPILGALSNANKDVHDFLVQILSDVMKGSSQAQRSNLKCFVWHLIQMLPAESDFSRLVVDSDLAVYFNEAEVAEMALEDIDSDHLYLQDLGQDVATAPTSYPSTRESSYNVSDVEGQLLAVYEPVVIRDLLTDLYENRGLHPSQIIALNDRWKVPKEIRQGLEFLPDAEFKQAYVFVLIAKARHCMDLSIFDRARQLLVEADSVVADLSYVLSKHVRWQVLLADLLQYFLSETVSHASSLQDLVKKTKTCLTSIRLQQDIQPSSEVLEQCTAFLLNIRDWEYLSNLENTKNGYIETSRLLACACKELPNVKNARKPAREFLDIMINSYKTGGNGSSANPQHRHSASGRDSAMLRDSQLGVLSKENFFSYIQKIKEHTILTLLMSAFAKLFSSLRDDITSEITTEYNTLWSTAISTKDLNVSAVEDMLKTIMAHALKVNPTHPSWLRTQADIYYGEGQYSTAMKFYLEAGVVATQFFSLPVTRNLYDDKVYRRMITCCTHLQCHTQVAVLCQFLDMTDYSAAFKALQERNVYDAMDAYYCCIWDVTILEFLVHLHTRKGEMDKRQCALRALSQMDLNSNNPEEIQRRAIHVRKTKFLRALAKQYVG
ncbi:integrator complex subunit 8-like isoform X2 [Babylonia areolata]|uniref:integrator complex subunit 8-like isoform X2 n=1 Tax=Babylonia areolata TaxID=304850 RepID=UPI003FD030FF